MIAGVCRPKWATNTAIIMGEPESIVIKVQGNPQMIINYIISYHFIVKKLQKAPGLFLGLEAF